MNQTISFTTKKSKGDVLKDLDFTIKGFEEEGIESAEDASTYASLRTMRNRVADATDSLDIDEDEAAILYAAVRTRAALED